MTKRIFTSESVSPGHPDKLCDQVSDSVLDAIISITGQQSRVACECLVKDNVVVLAGEIKTDAKLDYEKIIRKTINDIGYDDLQKYGFSGDSCKFINLINKQSPEISKAVDKDNSIIGAGDQGMMFGYATDETFEYMPLPIIIAHKLMQKQNELYNNKQLDWLRPDAKSQVSYDYNSNKITDIVFSTQHDDFKNTPFPQKEVIQHIIKPVLEQYNLYSNDINYYINPSGAFIIGGPVSDCGLTGRKIIVDTYGGMAKHGGGAFSGKDPTKVDRSAAYAMRYVTKNIVASGLAKKCEVQISYAIGEHTPVSINVNTFNTGDDVHIEKVTSICVL